MRPSPAHIAVATAAGLGGVAYRATSKLETESSAEPISAPVCGPLQRCFPGAGGSNQKSRPQVKAS